MITTGVDAHKEVHVAEAVDRSGRPVSQQQAPNTAEGWDILYGSANRLGNERIWGVEGAWSYGRGLAQHLVSRVKRAA